MPFKIILSLAAILIISLFSFMPPDSATVLAQASQCSAIGISVKTGTSKDSMGSFPAADIPYAVSVEWPAINKNTLYQISARSEGTTVDLSNYTFNVKPEENGKLFFSPLNGLPVGNYKIIFSIWGDITQPANPKPTIVCESDTIRIVRVAAGAPGAPQAAPGAPAPLPAAAVPAAAVPAAAADPCALDKSKCSSGAGSPCVPGAETLPTATTKGDGVMTAIGCIPTKPKELVEGLLRYGSLAAGGIAFVIMLLAALQMITAEGNPESIKGAQEKFYSAIIGLLLIIFSVLLMQVIGVDVLGLPDFSI